MIISGSQIFNCIKQSLVSKNPLVPMANIPYFAWEHFTWLTCKAWTFFSILCQKGNLTDV